MKTKLSHFLPTTFLVLISLSLISCSQKSSDKISARPPGPDSNIPQDVKAEAVVSMPGLSEQQIALLKESLKKSSLLPDRDLLLFEESRESTAEREERETKTRNLKPETRKVYDHIFTNCDIIQPKTNFSGDLSLSPGTRYSEQFLASVQGVNCHLTVESVFKSEIKTIASQPHPTEPEGHRLLIQDKSQMSRENLIVKNQELQKGSGLLTFNQTQTVNRKLKLTDTENESYVEIETSFKGKNFENKPFSGNLSIRTYSHVLKSDGSVLAFKKYIKHSQKIAGLSVVAQVFVVDNQQGYYLNGKEITESAFGEIFPDLVQSH